MSRDVLRGVLGYPWVIRPTAMGVPPSDGDALTLHVYHSVIKDKSTEII